MHSNTKAQTTHSDNTLQGSEPLRKVTFQGHKEGIRSANTQQARQDGDTSDNASWKNSLAWRTPLLAKCDAFERGFRPVKHSTSAGTQTTHSDDTLHSGFRATAQSHDLHHGSFQGHKEGIRSANTQQARQDGDTSENASWKNSLACRTPNTSMLHLLPTAFCDAAQIDRYGS